MAKISTTSYVYTRSKIWSMRRKKSKRQNRFDVYNLDPKTTEPTQNGLLSSPSDWYLATPNVRREENILLVGSNTLGSGVILKIKWRPNEQLNLYTMMTSFTIECGKDKPTYDYDEVWTQSLRSPAGDQQQHVGRYIEKYSGQNISLEVLIPYSKYRLFFSGYMRDRQNSNKLLYVRFRSIVSGIGKIYDFKEQYDSEFVARQLVKTSQQAKDVNSTEILNQLFLHDRHEQSVQFRCVYSLGKDDTTNGEQIEDQQLFCWGFHARHFIQPNDTAVKFTRVLGYISSGTWFHLGSVRSSLDNKQENKLDDKQENKVQMDFGYACPQSQLTYSIQQLDPVDWDELSVNGCKQLQLKFKCNNISIEVKSSPADGLNVNSDFIDIVSNEQKKGRAIILIDDTDVQDQVAISESVSDYVSSVRTKRHIIDLTYLDTEWAITKQPNNTYRPLVVGLNQQDGQYSSLCGAKAASLAQLIHYKSNVEPDSEFQVPNGVVLTRYAYDLILELNPNIQQAQQRLANAVNQDNKEDIRQLSEQIRSMFSRQASGKNDDQEIKKVNVPDQLITELKQAMLATYGIDDIASSDKSFAVRSSSWGEDDQDMSAAGQLTTLLSIRGLDQLCEAILICFASKYSLTNLEYKHQRGLPIDMPMAIVIQEMIECDKAGVLFTSDPINGDQRRMVITANYGLGESVVSAAADPDTIVVGVVVDQQEPNDFSKRRLDSAMREIKIGKKTVIMRSDLIESKQSQEYGLSKSDTLAESQQQHEQQQEVDLSKCCLNEEEINKLADCALKLIGYFRCARDIEWGLKDGQLYLFQSRPLTGLNAMNDFELSHEFSNGLAAEKEWLSRANIGEVMPLPISPLTMTYCFRFWGIAMEHNFQRLGLSKREDWFFHKPGEVVVNGYFGFFNLRLSRMFRFAGGDKRPILARATEISFFGHEVDEPELSEACANSNGPISGIAILKSVIDSIPLRYAADRRVARAEEGAKKIRQGLLEGKFVKSSSMADLFGQMILILPYLVDGLTTHLAATMLSSEYNYQPLQLLSKYIDEPTKLFACWTRLLSTVNSNVFSARVPRLINEMSEMVAAKGLHQLRTFLAMNDADSLSYITNDKSDDKLKKLFEKFLEDYGHRAFNEFDLRTQKWGENPIIVINMIKQSCQNQLQELESGEGPKKTAQNGEPLAGQLLEDVMRSKFNFLDRLRMNRFILPKCHKFVGVRESTKNLIIYLADCLRRTASILADEMRNQGRLPDTDLIFYLTLQEIKYLSEQPEPAIVMHAQRRRRYIQKVECWKFDEMLSGYEFYPRHLATDSDVAIKLANDMRSLPKIIGTPASSGFAEGRVCIVNEYKQLNKVKPGDILVTYGTDISFSPVFPLLAGIITEIGGMISHGAVIAREYGLPTLIGVSGACTIFEDGERVLVDANQGHVLRLDLAPKN